MAKRADSFDESDSDSDMEEQDEYHAQPLSSFVHTSSMRPVKVKDEHDTFDDSLYTTGTDPHWFASPLSQETQWHHY